MKPPYPLAPPDGGPPAVETAVHESDNIRAIGWMLASVVIASAMSIAVRELSSSFDSRMTVLLRAGITSLLLVIPVVLFSPLRRKLQFSRPWTHLIRGSLIGVSTNLGFYTLGHIPLATATVLFFTAPIFATVLSVLVHKENVGMRRWSAVIAGFLGAVIVLRPGFDGFHIAMLTAIGSSVMFAVVLTMSRGLAVADGAFSTYFSSVIITALITAPFAAPVFDLPTTPYVWFVVGCLVVTSTGRGIADIQAYRFGDASVMAPIAYLRVVILGTAGYLIWDEVPDLPTWIGAAIIILSTLYIARREAMLRRGKG